MTGPIDLLSLPVVLLAYLIGAIPFGFLIFYSVRGIDIRSVGSGNIGATNVGRNLGFRYFLLVFTLDLLKGLLPTLFLPRAMVALAGSAPANLAVFVALATILGHNFPIYLKFQGGKGVATSLGAVLALDPMATGAAVLGFAICLLATRFVSLSSIVGGLAFASAHFLLIKEPWSVAHRGVSLLTIALLILLIVRHRKNIGRILNGTEPKVMRSGARSATKEQTTPSGKLATTLLLVLIPIALLIVAGIAVARNALAPIEVRAGSWIFREVDRVSTGLQRADRIQFTEDGETLAVACPRYHKLVLYRVGASGKLAPASTIDLDGRPVALVSGGDRFLVLQRPIGDRGHLEPGWFEIYDRDGKRVGARVTAGFYPDDLALSPDRKALYLVSSGRGEGGPEKPRPKLEVFQTTPGLDAFSPKSQIEFEPKDDPLRIQVSRQGACGVVLIRGQKQAPAFDFSDPKGPRRIGVSQVPETETPDLSSFPPTGDAIVLPVETESEAVTMNLLGEREEARSLPFLACTQPDGAAVVISQPEPRRVIARFPLYGPLNLGKAHPSGIAYSERKKLLAVATRSGSVHVISIDSKLDHASTETRGNAATR